MVLDSNRQRITQSYRGGTPRAFERRHPDLVKLSIGKVAKRRLYRPDNYFSTSRE
jgi:hypothetical protein